MAKINHIEMGAEVMALDQVEVKKGFLGMGTKLIYKPTQSVIRIKENEYSAENGRRLQDILATNPENMEEAIDKLSVTSTGIGNMKLEACISDDHQFVAAQLLGFKDFTYQPVTEMQVYEGKAAEAFSRLF